jgi:mono/diheme cytochrome c family protein
VIANVATNVGIILAVVITVGWIVYGLFNLRSGRREVGSEIELAANRKPYYDDEVLEGRKLERTQMLGVVFLAVITIVLPVYWILEPGRQSGAIDRWEETFIRQGGYLFASTADGGFNCAGCHGGMAATGGVAEYPITDPLTGDTKIVSWKAPALDTVMGRFSDDEVRFILEYGRPFSPMSPWGLVGGGPMNDEQIQSLIKYMWSIQKPREGCLTPDQDPRSCDGGVLSQEVKSEIQNEAERLVNNGTYASVGESLFNLELGAGAYSCARCHTKGWSYGEPEITGGGALGPNLTGGSVVRQFPDETDLVNFLRVGSQYGVRYGAQGQGSGKMPGFATMLSDAQIQAIAQYIRSL